MISRTVEPPFKLTLDEKIVSSVITVCLLKLRQAEVPEVQLGKLVHRPQYGFTASAALQPVGPRFVRITDVKAGSIDWGTVPYCECPEPEKYTLDVGDILVARAGSVGKTFLVNEVPEPAVFASYLIRLQPKKVVSPAYIYWCMQSQQFWHQIMDASRGSAMKNINARMLTLLHFPFPDPRLQQLIVEFMEAFERYRLRQISELPNLPSPLSDLPRIVARIEELAARIEEARGLRQRAVEEAEALFEATVNNVFQSIDTPNTASLGNLASKIGSGSTPRGGRAVYVDDGIPFIRSQNVRMRRFQWDDIAFITPEIHASMSGTHVLPDDVLLNITGASIGRVACAPSELEAGNVNQHVAIIRPRDQEVLHPRYLMYWLSQPTIQDFINSEQKGATRQGFTKKQIEAFEIPLIPASNQDEIVSYLDALQARVEELKCLQAETAAELDALLPSILDKAFKGEL